MPDVIPIEVPQGLRQIYERYGDPALRIVSGEWQVDPRWESANLVTIHHTIIPSSQGGKLYVHKLIVPMLLATFDDWLGLQAGDSYPIRHIGCFAPRAQRGESWLASTHSWAIAFDLNPDTNPLIWPCPVGDPRRMAPGAMDIPSAWVAAAKARGWVWGGDFSRRFDPMHFQLAKGY